MFKQQSAFTDLYHPSYNNHRQIISLTWSPDGEKVTFFVRVGSSSELWMLDKTGAMLRSLDVIHGAYPSDLAWSFDSKFLAYISRPDDSDIFSLFVVDVASGSTTLIGEEVFYNPVWHPQRYAITIRGVFKEGLGRSLYIYELE